MATLDEKILEINRIFDEKVAAVNEEREFAISQAKVDEAVKGLSSMSMGNIISIFENVSSEVVKTKGGAKTVNDFLKLVKEDKNIHNSYLLKESLFNNVGINNPVEFINELAAVAKETNNPKTFKASKKNLVAFVSEAIAKVSPEKISDKLQLDEETKKLNDNVESLIWSKRNIQNAAVRTNSINETVDFLTKKLTPESKEKEFEKYKDECIRSIDEAWEQSDSNVRLKLTEVKDKLSKKNFSELTADEDIKYMRELIETIK